MSTALPDIKETKKTRGRPKAVEPIQVYHLTRRVSDFVQEANSITTVDSVEQDLRDLFSQGYKLEASTCYGWQPNQGSIMIGFMLKKGGNTVPSKDVKIMSVSLTTFTVDESNARVAEVYENGFELFDSHDIMTSIDGSFNLYVFSK